MVELKNGVYYSSGFSTLQKKRMLGGVFTEYAAMVTDDIVMFNQKDTLLVLVLPRVPNVIAYELTRKYRSNCESYDLIASVNIILEHLTDESRLQLILGDSDVDNTLLRNFSLPIRLIGNLYCISYQSNSILIWF